MMADAMGEPAMREAVVRPGDIVEGRYRIIQTLGEGGMGTVFLAEHALIKRRLAIKILHPELAADADVIERFMNEARAAGTLGHPNIVESTDMGLTHGHVPYIAFEYLEGTLLTDEIYRVGGMSVRRTASIAVQIASALHAAHNAGIVHRDLKSDNVFLTDRDGLLDHVKVLDFGISRFMEVEDRQRNMVMGTPEFMAPEQITSPEAVDRRADIYALGVILYEMLAARRPFAMDADPQTLLHRIVHEPPTPLARPAVPHGLVEILFGKMLVKDPAQRYQTMSEVESALEQFVTRGDGTPIPRRRTQPMTAVDEEALEDTPPPPRARTAPPRAPTPPPIPAPAFERALPAWAREPRVMYGAAAIGVLIGALGLVLGLRGHGGAAPAARHVAVQVDADAPGASVLLRRAVAPAPASLELAASNVLELVEVSAPGYRTERYWVAIDRPIHLHAHLAPGSGVTVATEEQTRVALGRSAPSAL